MLYEQLKAMLDDKVERHGLILNGEVIELKNTSGSPEDSCAVNSDDLFLYLEATATWHSHPDETSNLSGADMQTFLAWPNLDHYIIGVDGITRYYVEDGILLNEACDPSREP